MGRPPGRRGGADDSAAAMRCAVVSRMPSLPERRGSGRPRRRRDMPREPGSDPFSLGSLAPFPASGRRCWRRSRGCMSDRDPSPGRRSGPSGRRSCASGRRSGPSGRRSCASGRRSCPSGRGRCTCSGAGAGEEGGSAVPEGLPSAPGRVSVSLRMRRRRSRRGRRSMNSSNILGSVLFPRRGGGATLRRATVIRASK